MVRHGAENKTLCGRKRLGACVPARSTQGTTCVVEPERQIAAQLTSPSRPDNDRTRSERRRAPSEVNQRHGALSAFEVVRATAVRRSDGAPRLR